MGVGAGPPQAQHVRAIVALLGGHRRFGQANADIRPPFLLVTRDTIQFNTASDYALDLTGLKDLSGLAVERLIQAVALYRGRFLEEFSCDSAALVQYETCRRLLEQELGVEPAQETTALVESIAWKSA